jgi:hypothetical protein
MKIMPRNEQNSEATPHFDGENENVINDSLKTKTHIIFLTVSRMKRWKILRKLCVEIKLTIKSRSKPGN